MEFPNDRQIWFENGYHWDCGVLRAVYHASEDCTFIVEDRVGTFHALGMDKVELFAPGSSHNVQLSPDQDADREVNATFGEALLLFLIIPPGEYHLYQRVRWRVTGNRAVDVVIVGILHLPNHQIVYKVQVIEHYGQAPNGQVNLGIGTIHYIGVPPEATELSEIEEYSEGATYACPHNTEHESYSLTSDLLEHLRKEHDMKLPGYEELINDYVNGLHEVDTV